MRTYNTNEIAREVYPDKFVKQNLLQIVLGSYFEAIGKCIEQGYNTKILKFGAVVYNEKLSNFLDNKEERLAEYKEICDNIEDEHERKRLIKQIKVERFISFDESIKSEKQFHTYAKRFVKNNYNTYSNILKSRGILKKDYIRVYLFIKQLKFKVSE